MFKGWASYCKHKPKVSGDFDYYKIVFYLEPKDISQENGRKSIQKSTQKSIQKTLELVRQNSLITISELAQQTGLSEPGIKKHLKKLQQQGLLKRIGPDKGGHWEVIKEG